jgi:hypothetical protein
MCLERQDFLESAIPIDNHSGHSKPSEESTQVGQDALVTQGITFPN